MNTITILLFSMIKTNINTIETRVLATKILKFLLICIVASQFENNFINRLGARVENYIDNQTHQIGIFDIFRLIFMINGKCVFLIILIHFCF